MTPSHYDYQTSLPLWQYSFYQLLMAAMQNADTENLRILSEGFPDVYANLVKRRSTPGGFLPGERGFIGNYEYECLSDGTVVLVSSRERRTSHE